MRSAIMLVLLIFSQFSLSEEYTFSEEELASEAVLPVFDIPEAVKNRAISVTKRYEVGLTAGASLNEPFFSPYNFGGSVSYNTSEKTAWHGSFNFWMDGETVFKQQLENDNLIFLTGAPRLEYLALLSYQYSPFYGKISLTKQGISHFHLFGSVGGGIASIGGEMIPTVSVGLGQKFYFTKSFAIRFDLKGVVYNGPDPTSVEIVEGQEVPPTSEFSKRLYVNTLLTGSIVLLL